MSAIANKPKTAEEWAERLSHCRSDIKFEDQIKAIQLDAWNCAVRECADAIWNPKFCANAAHEIFLQEKRNALLTLLNAIETK